MIKNERQDRILQIVKLRQYCTVAELAAQLYAAPITVRRDLIQLEAAGLLKRCHGGATVPEYENREVPYELRNRNNLPVKRKIAQKAAELVSAGDVVFLDASSTVSHMAEFLPAEQNLTVITNSTLVAERLKQRHIRCYLTGGMNVENSYALVGSIAEQTVCGMYANLCFFSAQGIDSDGVISDQSELETALRKKMIEHSGRQYFLFDSQKLGKRFAFRLCGAEQLSGVITDLEGQNLPRGICVEPVHTE